MDTQQKELNDIQDELVLRLITQLAKPTVTLTQLKTLALRDLEELELRGALGRLWRSLKVYRHALTTGVVLYWPEERLKAVVTSGIIPQMPDGVELPETISHIVKPVEIAQEYQKQELQAEVKEEKLTRQEENHRKSKWQLVPISQTAALPMRPLAEGVMGNARRGAVVAEVLSAMFRYRDLRLSIDGVKSLIPHVSRTDVARVISQTVNGYGKKYILRTDGETRFDNTYQWNHEFSYPFPDRMPNDGERVLTRNVDPDVKDDEALDHLAPEQLTEVETESEIARLIRLSQEQAQEKEVIEQAVEEDQPKIDEEPEEEKEETQGFCAILPADMDMLSMRGPIGEIGQRGCGYIDLPVRSYSAEEVHSGKMIEKETILIDQVTVKEAAEANVVVDDNVVMPERRGQKLTINSNNFRAGFFTDGVMIIELDHGRLELTKEQTEQIADLLGPHYMRKVAA